MGTSSSAQRLKLRLNEMAADNPRCGGVFCSTCGGYAGVIPNMLTQEDIILVNDVLAELTLDQPDEVAPWEELLGVINQSSTTEMVIRSLESYDKSDLRAIDGALYKASKLSYQDSAIHNAVFALAVSVIPTALDKLDRSLIETLILTLNQALIPAELLDAAVDIAETDRQMARVLYNKLRNDDPRVRSIYERGS